MSVQSTDIKFYGSAVMPDDDTVPNVGGAIDTTKKVEFTQMTANSTLEAVSDNAADTTQTITVTGRDPSGVLVTETATLNGTTAVALGTTTFERILKVVLSGATTGIVSVRSSGGGTTWCTLEPGILEVRVPFYGASADPAGGVVKHYYEKIFVKNENASLALINATIAEQADPTGAIDFGLESTLDDTNTTADRRTAPVGITFDNTTKTVATGNLPAGSAQGIWLHLTLNPGDPAQKSSYTLRVQGESV